MMKPASKIKAIMIFIASSELVFKMEDKLNGMFIDFTPLFNRLHHRPQYSSTQVFFFAIQSSRTSIPVQKGKNLLNYNCAGSV